MATQSPARDSSSSTPAIYPKRFIPPMYTEFFISHQRLASAELSLLRDGTYVAIGDSYLDYERINAERRRPFRDNVEELWLDK